jgi:hydroxyacylglutathione hydrolase
LLSLEGNWGGGEIWRVVSGEFPSNAYICNLDLDGNAILIDGGLDPNYIDSCFLELNQTPAAVLCTHGHFDHCGSGYFFQNKYDIQVYLNVADQKLVKSSNFLLMALGLKSRIKIPKEVSWLSGNEEIIIKGVKIKFHEFAGHTAGSSIIEIGNALFTGDSIYAKGIGLSGLPGEDSDLLKKNIIRFWPHLTSSTNYTIYPGHGSRSKGLELANANRELMNFINM